MPKTKYKIKNPKVKQKVIEQISNPNLSLRKIEHNLKAKGINISDTTIGRYKESIYSGIIEVTPKLRTRLNDLVSNYIGIIEKILPLFQNNINKLSNSNDLLGYCRDNPQVIKFLNTFANYMDKQIRLNQSLSPSKSLDLELIKKQKKQVIRFDNLD